MNIIDSFIYSNEISMLKLRIKYLKTSVDTFCAVVGSHFFTGERKKNDFSEELNFANVEGVHLHIIVVDFTKDFSWHVYAKLWNRRLPKRSEDLQRLNGCKEIKKTFAGTDLVFFSDVDEIPKVTFIEKITSRKYQVKDPLRLKLLNFYYKIDLLDSKPWYGSFVSMVCDLEADLLRDDKVMTTDSFEGWHLSYMGGEQGIIDKLRTFAHQEYAVPALKNWDEVLARINSGNDLFGRPANFKRLDSLTQVYDNRMLTVFSDLGYFSEVQD